MYLKTKIRTEYPCMNYFALNASFLIKILHTFSFFKICEASKTDPNNKKKWQMVLCI